MDWVLLVARGLLEGDEGPEIAMVDRESVGLRRSPAKRATIGRRERDDGGKVLGWKVSHKEGDDREAREGRRRELGRDY